MSIGLRRRRSPSVETLIVATYGLLGLRLGARPLADNSALLHLRTGIDMVRHGVLPAIPRVDPFSFTAPGEPWVVQSWLPSALIGWAHRIGGASMVVVLSGVVMAGLAVLVATLARTGDVRRTALSAGVALAVSGPFWTPRPLLVGLACLGLTIWVVERGKSPWWLVPIAWVWVNSHGSFPLGLALLLLRSVGDAVDERARPRLGYAGWFVGGLLLAMLNPLGPKLLTFPLTVGEKAEIFRTVTEWRTVDFQQPDGLVALVGIVLALAVLTRRPVTWRHALPVAGFLGLGLLAQRNLAPLGIVLAPAMAAALRVERSGGASVPVPARIPVVFAGVLGALAALFVGGAATRPAYDVSTYPVAAVQWLEQSGRFEEPHRIVHSDIVGNYLELRLGRAARVFIDDRVDMYPLEVSRDYAKVLDAGRPAQRVLAKWRVDTVLWEADHPLVDRLLDSDEWTQSFRTAEWTVLTRV